ncbi:histone acetyltransferase HAC1 isoform X2 [Eucalyptus grandis]|nr:histone acetyltransferase HAC1 isoform X2 [Eucalyptus grandis]XP_010063703.1 histone acetyltransferase HAC1 isoform X2 [Eucalyptus grandis]XP_039171294.1 histone acetyltransferase HAC1 isoform X2 [Eucalyptus grandis]
MPGRVSSQSGAQLPGVSPQNGNVVPNIVAAGSGAPHGGFGMDADLLRARNYMQEKIFVLLAQRHQQQMNDSQMQKLKDIVKRLEEGLFKTAPSKEEYLNMSTLEFRLHSLIKRPSLNNRNPVNPNSMPTMIPTPGLSHNGSSTMMATSSVDAQMSNMVGSSSMQPTNSNTGNLMSSGVMQSSSFNRTDGLLSNGYQQAQANYPIGSGGNNLSQMGVPRMSSQMIPTPGFNNNSGNHSYGSVEATNNGGRMSIVDSPMVSQDAHQKLHVSNQNSRVLHALGSQAGGAIRSGIQQKSYGFSNGALNGGLGMIGSNLQMSNGPSTSEGFLNASPYINSPKPLQHQFDQYQRSSVQGDVYGNSTDVSGPGNLYTAGTSVGTMANSQSMGTLNLQSLSKTKASLVANPPNLHSTQQAAQLKPQSVDAVEKVNFQPALPSRENFIQSQHQQQFQQQAHYQQQQQFAQQRQHMQQNQRHQGLLDNEMFGLHQVTSDPGNQFKQEPKEIMPEQASDGIHLPEFQNRYQQNPSDNKSKVQLFASQTNQHNSCSMLSQNTPQVQHLLQSQQLVAEAQNEFTCHPVGLQSDSVLHGQWNPQLQDGTEILGNKLNEQHLQDDFQRRISKHDEAQCNNLSSEGSVAGPNAPSRGKTEAPTLSTATCRSGSTNRDRQFRNQQRWLLFIRHARRCAAPQGKCQEINCITVQKLCKHIESCNLAQCPYPRCHHTKVLLSHNKNCRDPSCPVCIPVKNYLQSQLKAYPRPDSTSGFSNSLSRSCKPSDIMENPAKLLTKKPSIAESSEDLLPSIKRVKVEPPLQLPIPSLDNSAESMSIAEEQKISQSVPYHGQQHNEIGIPIKAESADTKMDPSGNSGERNLTTGEMKMEGTDDVSNKMLGEEPAVMQEPMEKEGDQSNQEIAQPAEQGAVSKSGKPKIKGVSLTELFTPEQVREHITGLRQWVGQSKAKAERNQAMEHSMSENSCQLCAVEKLTFEPPPIYCSPCGARIKRNAPYYTGAAGDTRHYFCIPCYNEARGDTIVVDGNSILKARLEKKKNDEETEEWWVQCDKCEAWQHQICALFNGRRNDGGQAEYTCPNCYIAEVERGERKPLPQNAVLGAKDLPKTLLSDHIEQRLAKRLRQERLERAKVHGKSYDEVPGAESLVVRVVSSVDKKLEVKPRFLEIFQEENYPTEFPYKSKVILLFQKIEGVEVCLFGMYVQEFGSESQFPNQRRVYLSYLDSVKYFRPEVKAVTGEALRTFVYHEILIGYLEYCKLRGFTSCYIWACPPLKGEDYILYCHPEIQKTPKSDKLREWYLAMLRKAAKESIVVDLTNLYDHFFVCSGECKSKVTAARLPYFDGDYWPGAAEDLIYQLQQEEDGRKQNKKGTTKKTITKRALKASGQSDLSGNASKDLLLMHKLGETISPMKEDFIMVHLQYACTHCCILMVSGNRWVCSQCKNFQICDKCHEIEQKREERERHPVNQREKHLLYPIQITDVPEDTKDKDEILESEFFDTRQAFLSLCQGNHYQYDTLRRAKHSSMMVLYHLHNPTAPAFVTTCNLCSLDIEAGQGWRCEVCPEYDICNTCYQKDGGIDHPHKLTNHPSMADRDAQNKEARQLRVLQLRKMLDLLVHASQCRSALCQYPNCRKVKGLFRHGIQCKTRASRGCVLCKKMWYLLQLHARACKEAVCHVPRCRDLREHLRRLQQQSDSRRRAAVMEMMRQRAAEVANNGG